MTHTPTISTHVLDTERGEPAVGVPVALARRDGDAFVTLATRETNADGRIPDLIGGPLRPGVYQLVFDVATYLRRRGRDPAFFARVALDFEIRDTARHYHVPLLLTPYSCASYRGS